MKSASSISFTPPAAALLLLLGCQQPTTTLPTTTQQSSASGYSFTQGYPTADAAKQAIGDTDYQRAIQAYRFWYPTVSAEGIFQGNRDIGLPDNVKATKGAAGPIQVGFTLNSDTPYGSAAIDLSQGPWVMEVPPGPFIGLADDHNQGWIADVGIPGPNAGKGDKLLLLPPNYKGDTPAG